MKSSHNKLYSDTDKANRNGYVSARKVMHIISELRNTAYSKDSSSTIWLKQRQGTLLSKGRYIPVEDDDLNVFEGILARIESHPETCEEDEDYEILMNDFQCLVDLMELYEFKSTTDKDFLEFFNNALEIRRREAIAA